MTTLTRESHGKTNQPSQNSTAPKVSHQASFKMEDNRPEARQFKILQQKANGYAAKQSPIQQKENNTGLPGNLKSGIENLSSHSMDDVKVHYNSDKPAQLNAHAYAQGTDIHLAPGQEKHLPHEAWHVVQQKQGRVKPTMQMQGKVNVNDDLKLEKEADVMGKKALQMMPQQNAIPNAHAIVQTKGAPHQNPSDLASKQPVQRYTDSVDGQFHISENNAFAVSSQAYPDSLFSSTAPPIGLIGGLVWNQHGALPIDHIVYNRYVADISAYEANGKVGSEQHCGAFARDLANDSTVIAGADRSTGVPGEVLKDGESSPGMDDGWENHFATVVKVDGGDHATFETAVGIPHTWVGIYGVNRGQTFKYKTQVANIQRMMGMEDIVLPGGGPVQKAWWQYLLCCFPGTKTDLVIPRGITEDEAETYQAELTAWRDHGTPPNSAYMIRIVAKLEAELQQTGGQ